MPFAIVTPLMPSAMHYLRSQLYIAPFKKNVSSVIRSVVFDKLSPDMRFLSDEASCILATLLPEYAT
jgi:hypothetical protein